MGKIYILNIIPAYFQFFFLPGFIYLFYLRFKTNFFSFLAISFCISLVVNYILIFILNLIGFYSVFSLWLFLLLEIIFIFQYKEQIGIYLSEIKKISLTEYSIIKKETFYFFAAFFALGLIAEPLYSIFKDNREGFFQVFTLGDVLEYYSKWAREWYGEVIPKTTFFRPQLWSADISMIYKFFGNEYFEPFAKQIFNFIFIYLIISTIGICFTNKNCILFFGSILGIYYSLTGTVTQGNSGYMEIPLSLSLIFFLNFAYEVKSRNVTIKQIVYILPIIISCIFLTKELGWIFSFAILLYFYFFDKLNYYQSKISIKNFLKICFITGGIFLPFYIYTFINYEIFNIDNPVFKLLFFDANTHIGAGHGSRYLNLDTRIIDGIKKTPEYLVLPLLINLLFSFSKDNLIKYVISPFILIYYLVWLVLMSNEFRYLFPIIVITWCSFFIIAYQIIRKTKNIIFLRKLFLPLLIIMFFSIILTNKKIPDKNLFLKKVDQKKLSSMNPDEKMIISNFLNIYDKVESKDKIFTNIISLRTLSFSKLKNTKVIYFENLIDDQNKDFSFIVVKGDCKKFKKYNLNELYFNKDIGCILSYQKIK